jgi:hypothetical protein
MSKQFSSQGLNLVTPDYNGMKIGFNSRENINQPIGRLMLHSLLLAHEQGFNHDPRPKRGGHFVSDF